MPRRKPAAAIKKLRKRAKDALQKAVPRLPRRQLTLPAGYLADGGDVATLRDVLSPRVATIDGGNLSNDDRARLTLLRIDAQRDIELVGPGFVLDKARALEEVRQRTPLGEILVAIENRTIEFLRQTAAVQRRRRQKQYRDQRQARKKSRHKRR